MSHSQFPLGFEASSSPPTFCCASFPTSSQWSSRKELRDLPGPFSPAAALQPCGSTCWGGRGGLGGGQVLAALCPPPPKARMAFFRVNKATVDIGRGDCDPRPSPVLVGRLFPSECASDAPIGCLCASLPALSACSDGPGGHPWERTRAKKNQMRQVGFLPFFPTEPSSRRRAGSLSRVSVSGVSSW